MTSKVVEERRKVEKPSLLSKRVLKTNQRNEWESVKLTQELKGIEKQRFHYSISRLQYVDNLHKFVRDVKRVKTKAKVSPERKRFIIDHGYKIKIHEYDVNAFIAQIDEVTAPHKHTYRARSAPPTRRLVKRPLLRLSDFIQDEKQKCLLRKSIVIEDKDKRKSSDNGKQREKKISNIGETVEHKLNSLYIREIRPPIRGREVWKVHQEQQEEASFMCENEQDQDMRKMSRNSLKPTLQRKLSRSPSANGNNKNDNEIIDSMNEEAESYRSKLLAKHGFLRSKQDISRTDENKNKKECVRKTFLSPPGFSRDTTIDQSDPADSIQQTKVDLPDTASRSVRRTSVNYSQMQLTMGGKCVSVFVPKFNKV